MTRPGLLGRTVQSRSEGWSKQIQDETQRTKNEDTWSKHVSPSHAEEGLLATSVGSSPRMSQGPVNLPPDLRNSSARYVHLRPDLPTGLNPIRFPFDRKDVPINPSFSPGSNRFVSAAVGDETVEARAKKKRERSARKRARFAAKVERRRASDTLP